MRVYINPILTVITTINSTVNLKNDISEFHHLLWVNLDLFHSEVKFLKGPWSLQAFMLHLKWFEDTGSPYMVCPFRLSS